MMNGICWSVVPGLFAYDIIMFAECASRVQRALDEFHSVCLRKKLRVNVRKSDCL